MLFAGSKSSGIGIKIWTKEVVTSQKLSSSLGEAKNYSYQRYFVPYKICIVSFHSGNHHVFMAPIESR
jgi:hypothetical protein